MATVVEMDAMHEPVSSMKVKVPQPNQGCGDCADAYVQQEHSDEVIDVQISENKENEELEKTSESECVLDGKMPSKEVQIDIEKNGIVEGNPTLCKQVSLISVPEDFSEEKEAPEMSTRVYDFNMVKQKTLPRISFGSTGVFRALSTRSKTYILAWTLMPLILIICIAILVFYLVWG